VEDYASKPFVEQDRPIVRRTLLPRGLKFILVTTVVVSVFALGVIIGQSVNPQQLNLIPTFNNPKQEAILKNQSSPDANIDFSEFWKVWAMVNQKHIDAPFDQKKMMYGAIKGMISATGDPHTDFFTAEESKDFSDSLNGNFGGIGIEIEEQGDKILILSTLDNTPAKQAGLLPGDALVGIDEKPIGDDNIQQVVQRIRGEIGTKVRITIERNNEQKSFDITRATVSVPSVRLEMLENNIAYVRIVKFGDDTSVKFDSIAREALSKQPRGMILDLRSNPGGYLDAGIHIAKTFFSNGLVMREKDKSETKEFIVEEPGILNDIPLVVLVNSYSASASEIVAGAIKDRGRGKLVGTTTFGKGTVQNLIDLENGTKIKLSIAKWFPPSDNNVQGKGIQPDVVVEIPTQSAETPTPVSAPENSVTPTDPQLAKAIEVLLQGSSEQTTPTP